MEPTAIFNLIFTAATPAFGAAVQGWSESAASILIGSLWQGATVACGLALCLRLAPRIPARMRYAIWAAGFAALFCLPFLPLLIHFLTPGGFNSPPDHPFRVAASGMASVLPSHPLFALDARWSLALAALWIAASLVCAAGLAAHAVRMRRLWHSARPVAAPDLDSLLQKAAMRTARPAELCITSDLDRPCVIGFFRPRILIPAWLLNRLTPAELGQVVLHESEHLRRMDDWANLLQKLCLVVFPLNPALWWLERRLCAEREMACDDGVVGRTQAPRAYAACLAGLAERGLERRQAALSLGVWQRRPELAMRVHRLLRRSPVLNPAASAVSVALVGCGLVAGTFALAHSPQLVAFVAPLNQSSKALSASAREISAQPDLVYSDASAGFAQGPAAFADSNAKAIRAVKTMAIFPNARATSLPRRSNATQRSSSSATDQAQQTDDSNRSGHSLASLVPAAVAAQMRFQKASQSAAPQPIQTSANQTSSTQTGWIVFTTYEEVQTNGSDKTAQGDAVDSEAKSSAVNTDANRSTSISVTRLVLHFVQPTSNMHPASNGQPASNVSPASNSPQRIAIPYRDGWFVIQL